MFFQDQAQKGEGELVESVAKEQKEAFQMAISHDFRIAEGGMHIKHCNQAIFEFQWLANEKVLEWDSDTFILEVNWNVRRMELGHFTVTLASP